MTILCPRVALKRYLPSDLPDFSALMSNADVMRHTEGPMSKEDTKSLFDRLLKGVDSTGIDAWAVTDRESDEFLGHAVLKSAGNRKAEIIVVLDKPVWGIGIATEVIQALIEHGFSKRGLHRIEATIDPDHTASIRLAEKIGMTFDRLEEDEAGRYPIYSLDAGDWQRRLISNPKGLVQQGYDRLSEKFGEWTSGLRNHERDKYIPVLLDLLPEEAKVLELGCGYGGRTTKLLASRYNLIGVDISREQLEFARLNVPNAEFIQADMVALEFEPTSFDAVVALYSLIHIPRSEHAEMINSIASWLKPNGIIVVTMGADSVEDGFESNWLGVPMFWSHFDSETNKKLVTDAGFEIIIANEETAIEDGTPVTFLWVIARKPA
jgi:RimJ/RimL family protein N-acetyltransferase/predicted TPR repeat methyltransferase